MKPKEIKKIRSKILRILNKEKKVVKVRPPRYDKVYYEGMKWLNSL